MLTIKNNAGCTLTLTETADRKVVTVSSYDPTTGVKTSHKMDRAEALKRFDRVADLWAEEAA